MTDRDSRLRVLREPSALTHGRGGRRKPAADKALTVRVQQEPGYVLIIVAGEIDIATVAWLEEELAALGASAKPMVADLEEVRFIDASGLRALGHAAGQAAAHGASFHVICRRQHIVRLFRITKLDRRILLAGSRAEALQALGETEA